MSALQHLADRCAVSTVTLPWLVNRCPGGKSLLNPSASSFAASVMLVIVAFEVLMMFQPSRSLAVEIVRWSDFTPSQPLISAAKCPPRASVMPDSVRLLHRVMDSSLSAWPDFGLPVMNLPPPSILPEPTKLTLLTLSPQNIASWKWLWPKSWNLSLGLDSGASYPEPLPVSTAPESSWNVTLLFRCTELLT